MDDVRILKRMKQYLASGGTSGSPNARRVKRSD
jgi:hypothetical protein